MTPRRYLRLGLGVGLGALFLWLVLRRVDVHTLVLAIADACLSTIAASMAAFSIGYACRIGRWRQMLLSDNPQLRWRDCAGPLLGSFAVNNVLPFRAGDLMRAFAFNTQLRVSAGAMLASLLAERLLDLLMLVFALGLAFAAFGLSVNELVGIGALTLFAVAAFILAVLLAPKYFAPPALSIARGIARLWPGVGQRGAAEVEKSMAVLSHFSSTASMTRLLLWSLAVWLAEGMVFWLVALSIIAVNAPAAAWLALPVGTLATLIPSTPGHVGTFDYFVVQSMITMGNSLAASTAFALLIHMLLWLPPTLFGGLYLLTRTRIRN